MVLGMVGLSPGKFVLDGDPALLPQKGQISLSLSLPDQDVLLSKMFPIIDSLVASGHGRYDWTVSSEHFSFCF